MHPRYYYVHKSQSHQYDTNDTSYTTRNAEVDCLLNILYGNVFLNESYKFLHMQYNTIPTQNKKTFHFISGRYNDYPKIVDITVNVAASTTAVVVTSFNTKVTVYWFVFESKEQVILDTSSCTNPEFANAELIACC